MSTQTTGLCIYCAARADSREHWLPRAFGTFDGISQLSGRLCRDCNRALGQDLDEEISRTGPTSFHRQIMGIAGRRSHTAVSPFHYRAASARPPTVLTMPAPQEGVVREILAEAYKDDRGRKAAKPLRQVVVRLGTRVECVPFPRAWGGSQLLHALSERRLTKGELVELYVDPDEGPDTLTLREVLTEVFGTFSVPAYGGLGSTTRETVTLSAGISERYLRAIIKIAFHYTLWALPQFSGREPEFAPVRQYVRHGNGEHSQFIRLAVPQFLSPLDQGIVPSEPSHFLFAKTCPLGVMAFVQFFVGPDDLPPPSSVRLSETPHDIEVTACHQLQYFGEKHDGHDGRLIEVSEPSGDQGP